MRLRVRTRERTILVILNAKLNKLSGQAKIVNFRSRTVTLRVPGSRHPCGVHTTKWCDHPLRGWYHTPMGCDKEKKLLLN